MSTVFAAAGETQVHQQTEWKGSASQKFTTNKRHVAAPQPNHDQPHPLFSAGARQHFTATRAKEFEWKPCLKVPADKDAPRPDKVSGVKYLNPTFGQNVKRQPERMHSNAGQQTQNTFEDMPVGKQTYIMHNRKTQKEVEVTKAMGSKKRVGTQFEARNGLPMASLGDKTYKSPEYQPGYFREGGLIAGSTNAAKARSNGNANAIDFYTGLKLDGPLNAGMKTYVQVQKEKALADETEDVKTLRQWERNILREVDENYDPDDDSSDEEAIAERAKRDALKEKQEAEDEANNAAKKVKK